MGTFCFPKEARLRKRAEYIRMKQGRRMANGFFIAVAMPGKTPKTRLGITVTKKVGSACVRNRLKRFAREYFRLHGNRLGGPYDILIIAKDNAARLGSKEAFAALENLFDRMVACPVS